VQGVGHVGEHLVKYISEEGAKVFITDINKDQLQIVSKKFDAEIVSTDAIYDLDIDIYAPCALGATLNTENINRLKCSIVAGAANNQLADEQIHAKMVSEKGILYAPDFLINAGGLINVYSEIKGYDRETSLEQAKNIYTTTLEIFRKAKKENITTASAARIIAEERLMKSEK
jgi:leucine dehydrogenase